MRLGTPSLLSGSVYLKLTFPEQFLAAPVWTSSLLSHSHCAVPVLPKAAGWCPAPPNEVHRNRPSINYRHTHTHTSCLGKVTCSCFGFFSLSFPVLYPPYFSNKSKNLFEREDSLEINKHVAVKKDVSGREKTHMGLRTSIFIFCLGVLSPWRMTAMTQRSSILNREGGS